MPAASTVVQGAMRRRTSTHKPVQLTRADITTAEVELAGERAQELVALLHRDWSGQLHHLSELLVGEADRADGLVVRGRPGPRHAGDGGSSIMSTRCRRGCRKSGTAGAIMARHSTTPVA
jgi:hypothetical protein